MVKKYIKRVLTAIVGVGIVPLMGSCTDGPKDPVNPILTPKQTTLLVYAVATNSLSRNLVSDKNEMLQAAQDIDLDKNNILVFETQYNYLDDNSKVSDVNLLKLVKDKNNQNYSWEKVRDFNDGTASLDPTRVQEIINYVTTSYKAENYGLIFWSHSTASQPYFADEVTKSSENTNVYNHMVTLPMQYSFGQDIPIGSGNPYYQINIDDLANAIPDHLFEFIWFDSCYMSNIETIYQFRNKCNTFVGYPTEVLDAGLPYHNVLPYLVGTPDLVHAAELFYDYYSGSFATVAVVDTKKIDDLADVCKKYFGEINVSPSVLMKYSRSTTGPFYDLGDYAKAISAGNGNEISEEWDQALEKCVLYKATTNGTLLGLSIDPDRFSGISTHLYNFPENDSDNISVSEQYYRSLDWFKRVF